jgi:hypothetical protein
MKIKLVKGVSYYDDTPTHDVLVLNDQNNLEVNYFISSLCECSEDAIIGRDLIDGYDLIKIAKLAYEAGKNGEELILEMADED